MLAERGLELCNRCSGFPQHPCDSLHVASESKDRAKLLPSILRLARDTRSLRHVELCGIESFVEEIVGSLEHRERKALQSNTLLLRRFPASFSSLRIPIPGLSLPKADSKLVVACVWIHILFPRRTESISWLGWGVLRSYGSRPKLPALLMQSTPRVLTSCSLPLKDLKDQTIWLRALNQSSMRRRSKQLVDSTWGSCAFAVPLAAVWPNTEFTHA